MDAQAVEAPQYTGPGKMRLPRAKLKPGTLALLILLRIYVILAVPVVTYAFMHALANP